MVVLGLLAGPEKNILIRNLELEPEMEMTRGHLNRK